jgi:hypothetical protein
MEMLSMAPSTASSGCFRKFSMSPCAEGGHSLSLAALRTALVGAAYLERSGGLVLVQTELEVHAHDREVRA